MPQTQGLSHDVGETDDRRAATATAPPRSSPTTGVGWERQVRIAPPVRDVVRVPLAARRQRWERRYSLGLVGLDAAVAGVAALVALVVRFGGDTQGGLLYKVVTLLFPVVWVAAMAMGRAYEPRFLGGGGEEYRRVFDAAVRLLAVVAVVFLAVRFDVARGFIVLIFPTALVLTLAGRFAARRVQQRLREQHDGLPRMLVVGRERAASEVLGRVSQGAGYVPVGVCVDRPSGTDIDGVPVVGGSHEILDALARVEADTVAVAAWSNLSQQDLRHLSWQLEGTGVDLLVAPSLTDIAGPRISIRPEAGLPLLHVDEPRFNGPQRAVKAVFDRGVALAALLVLSPLLVLLALAVRLDSAGPGLFRQTRVGTDGRPFTIYKFRSMYVDAEQRLAELEQHNEASDGLLFKMRDDPRVTRVGSFLRRFSLDELPQLFNVLGGSMSLVGPRPPLPREVDRYADDVRRRLLVKPGLTGLWQINGRSDLPWAEAVRLDLHYVENWSPALDLLILWRTVGVVLSRTGAY